MDSRLQLIDLQTGEPIANAHIYINGDIYPTTSDSGGNMTVSVNSFPYKAKFSHVSYEPHEITVNNGIFRVIELIKRTVQLPEIEIKPDAPKKSNTVFILIIIVIVAKLLKLF